MKRAIWFVVLAYVASWSWWVPLAISGVEVDQGQGWPTHLIGLMGPALAAIIVTGVFILTRFGEHNAYHLSDQPLKNTFIASGHCFTLQ